MQRTFCRHAHRAGSPAVHLQNCRHRAGRAFDPLGAFLPALCRELKKSNQHGHVNELIDGVLGHKLGFGGRPYEDVHDLLGVEVEALPAFSDRPGEARPLWTRRPLRSPWTPPWRRWAASRDVQLSPTGGQHGVDKAVLTLALLQGSLASRVVDECHPLCRQHVGQHEDRHHLGVRSGV